MLDAARSSVPDGVGSVNARSETAVFTDVLVARPNAYTVAGSIISLLKDGAVLHKARYGELTVEKASAASVVKHFEMDQGQPVHVANLRKVVR